MIRQINHIQFGLETLDGKTMYYSNNDFDPKFPILGVFVSFYTLFAVVFKLMGVLHISWYWVFGPMICWQLLEIVIRLFFSEKDD